MTASEVEKTAAQNTSPQGKEGASPAKSEGTDRRKEAMNQFVAGKRHLLVKDLEAAVSSLGMACELLAAEYGEAAYECADAYYYYGKALLEMARAESGVFGNALDGVPDGEDTDNSQVEDPDKMTEEERTDVETKVGEALDENFQVLEEKKERRQMKDSADETEEDEESATDGEKGESDEKETEKEETEADKEAEPEKSAESEKEAEKVDDGEKEVDAEMKDEESVGDNDAQEKEGEDKKEQEAEDEEDPSNLQLAWEMLELAKVAYTNKLKDATDQEKRQVEVKVCETLLTLGEVSLESETYDQAVADITDCLNRRKVLYAADSRRMAETRYHLGVALGHANKFDEAVQALNDSIACLELRMDNLKNEKESRDEENKDAFYTREVEITEISSLLPEIKEKIQDIKDMKEQSQQNQAEQIGFKQNGESSAVAKPISTISVKRKADAGDQASPKKAHIENGADKKE